jgi:hypothetical protein
MAHPPPSGDDMARAFLELRYDADEIARRQRTIHDALRADSARIHTANFERLTTAELQMLFELYDRHFFEQRMQRFLQTTQTPLRFELSSRLTRSAGLTKRFGRRPTGAAERYEIVISTPLLFQTFQDVQRTVRVNGLVCADRLEALQRILEHELLHLAEMVAWGRSSCAAERFRSLAWNVFGHLETKHDLVTQHEVASEKFEVRVGDRVEFVFEGVRHRGILNRITRRATVLVENANGQLYGDGKRYAKYYVPLAQLKKVEE